jgi:hypothetical protein
VPLCYVAGGNNRLIAGITRLASVP